MRLFSRLGRKQFHGSGPGIDFQSGISWEVGFSSSWEPKKKKASDGARQWMGGRWPKNDLSPSGQVMAQENGAAVQRASSLGKRAGRGK